MFRTFGGLFACLALAAPAFASPTPDWSFGGAFGTVGMGPQLAVRTKHFGVHWDGAFMGMRGHVQSRDVRYRSRLATHSAGMMLDLFPFGGQFRFSAGTRYTGSSGTLAATPGQQAMIGGTSFTPAQMGRVIGRADAGQMVPAVSFGFGNTPRKSFSWRLEAGLMGSGGVQISTLTTSTGLIPTALLAAERADMQNNVGRYHLFPIAQFEIVSRF